MSALIVNSTVRGFENMQNLASKVGSVEFDVGSMLLARIKKRFLLQESADGEKWPESHAAKLRKISGRDGGTLFDTGTLFHSIKVVLDGDKLSIQTNVEYAASHNSGYDGFYAVPKREFLAFNTEDETLARDYIEDRIKEQLK